MALLIIYAIAAVIIGLLAARKNRNGWAWGLIGGLFLVPGLLVLMFMPYLCPKCKQSISNKEWKNRNCPRCGDISLNETKQEPRKPSHPQTKPESSPREVAGEEI